MIKRVTAAVGCAAFCLALLTGCSGSGGDNGGKVTLKAVTQFGGDDPAAELFSTIIEEWETDTGNSVTNDSAKADNVWKSRVIADFSTGAEPDVMFFFNGSVTRPIQDKIVTVDEIRRWTRSTAAISGTPC